MLYANTMVLSLRNNCFKLGIAVSVLSLIIILAAASTILPAYPEVSSESTRCSSGILQWFIKDFLEASPYVPFVTTIGSVIYSMIGISLIYYFFEKTQSPEILFIGLFVISLAFECIRIMVPLAKIFGLPSIYLVRSSRVLIFGRYFGLFSLFVASVYTIGLEIQKQESIIFITAAAALIFALGVPTDGLSWDSTLSIHSDFGSTLSFVQAVILGITIASFLLSTYTRGSKDYSQICVGAVLICAGRNILLSSDTWLSPFFGLLILSLGTWLVCVKLHRIYLWL